MILKENYSQILNIIFQNNHGNRNMFYEQGIFYASLTKYIYENYSNEIKWFWMKQFRNLIDTFSRELQKRIRMCSEHSFNKILDGYQKWQKQKLQRILLKSIKHINIRKKTIQNSINSFSG